MCMRVYAYVCNICVCVCVFVYTYARLFVYIHMRVFTLTNAHTQEGELVAVAGITIEALCLNPLELEHEILNPKLEAAHANTGARTRGSGQWHQPKPCPKP